MSTSNIQYTLLFGGQLGWNSDDWTDSDDKVRGGSSQSYLNITDNPARDRATFTGILDTQTLGGAGFASQRTTSDSCHWDLSSAGGVAITYDPTASDEKVYTFILKDILLPPDPDTGREQSTISWEYDFRVNDLVGLQHSNTTDDDNGLVTIRIPWTSFKPTYRGREVKDAKPLNTDNVRRLSIMNRSFFDTQSGPFKLDLISIATFQSSSKTATEDGTMARAQDADSTSTTTTLRGDENINMTKTDKSTETQISNTTNRSLWSRLLCRY